jgi:UDP-N-acetylglucosamine 2-epimerase (non-hydrolysing)
MPYHADLPYIAVVVGTRPEIVKLASVIRMLGPRARLLHSGQHYDHELSGVFLADAGLPEPELLSGIAGVPRHVQIGRMIDQFGAIFSAAPPAAVLVQGDTNTAAAGAQAGNYTGAQVVHVEAGLRSYDRAMPEELNRCVIGVLADLHCAPTPRAVANLRAEGVPDSKIVLTGNTIVEATRRAMPGSAAARAIVAAMGADAGGYVLATIHRPENTDDPRRLEMILDELGKMGAPVLIPLHPRTRHAIHRHGLQSALDRLCPIPPTDHRTFLGLAMFSRLIISDSGGIQEECSVLKRPLIVVRNSTERPESVEAGFAHLVQPGAAMGEIALQLLGDPELPGRLAQLPCPFGDGKASHRIAACLMRILGDPEVPVGLDDETTGWWRVENQAVAVTPG